MKMSWMQYRFFLLCSVAATLALRVSAADEQQHLRRTAATGDAAWELPKRNKRIVVRCKPDRVEQCRQELDEAPAGVVIHEMEGTDFFAIEILDDETHHEEGIIRELEDVLDVADDPPRHLMVMPPSYDHGREIPPSRHLFKKDADRHLVGESNGNNAFTPLAGERVPYGIDLVNAPEVWDTFGKQGEGITICVVDTGLRITHEDFQGLSITGKDRGSFFNTLEWDEDGDGHGTHVTGTCAAVAGNGKGVVGVAPKANLVVARVFDDNGNFFGSDIVQAMRDCKNQGADIITMSLGGTRSLSAEQQTVEELYNEGIFLVAATGNDGVTSGPNLRPGPIEYPAAYDFVVGVGATDDDRKIASFSTFGEQVDVVAPGVGVESTFYRSNSDYTFLSGTSMATPHVAGVAALLKSINPSLSPGEIKELLQSTAMKTGIDGVEYNPLMYGSGHVDALAAAQAIVLESTISPSPTIAPTACPDCVDGKVTIKTDKYGEETTWKIVDSGEPSYADSYYDGGPYPNDIESEYVQSITLRSSKCYDLVVLDKYGDGMCCGYGSGYVKVEFDGKTTIVDNFGTAAEKSELRIKIGTCGGADDAGDSATTPAPMSPTQAPTDVQLQPTPNPTTFPTTSPTAAPTDSNDNVAITILTDRYAEESSWAILSLDGDELFSGGPYDGTLDDETTIVEKLELDSDGCYQFLFKDSYGDGICCGYGIGSYELSLDGISIVSSAGSEENFNEKRHYFGNAPNCPSPNGCGNGELEGTEECDDGVNNSDSVGSVCTTQCKFNGSMMQQGNVKIATDNYGSETTWYIENSSGARVAEGGPYPNVLGGTIQERSFSASPNDCYMFHIDDSFGDGICCGYGSGSFSIFFDGELAASEQTFEGDFATTTFGNLCR